MKSLTFDKVMAFCEPNNTAIFEEMKLAHQRQQLTPFVGAGLSVFCGYKLWPQILNDLASYLTRKEQQEEALQMIRKNQYLDAAQYIQDHYPRILQRLPSIIDYSKIDTCSPRNKKQSAAWVLPWLFANRPIMTTNFDSVLETLFREQGCPFQQVVQPHDPSLLTQTRQGNLHNLFKLHGEIGQDAVALDRLVFTKNKYDDIYAEKGELWTELNQWYENQKLLFLGCSLAMDKTMEVLKAAVERNPGITHYAIVGCKKEQIDELLIRFGALGIDAIFYDDSDHNAVRVILERLLEENGPAAYQEFKKKSWISPERSREETRLMFNADYFAFTGRQEEMQILEDFCNAEENTLWWSVTGPGGMGKSRLVYECCKKMEAQGWNTVWFEASPSNGRSIRELQNWTPDVCQTLVVLDDVQAHMDIVSAWMEQVSHNHRSNPLRVLLLEREGKDLYSAAWLTADPWDDTLETWCHDETFLSLKPMTDENMMAIMDDFAAASGKKLNSEALLKTLERVDPVLKRPMYAIAIADARCNGSDPTQWKQKEVLDMLVARELKFHFNRIKGLGDVKISKSFQTEIEELLARSCIQGFLILRDIDLGKYKQLQKMMDKFNMEPQEFFERMGLLSQGSTITIAIDAQGHQVGEATEEHMVDVIAMSCPDLIKEYLVLNLALKKNRMALLFPDGWETDPGQLLFLRKLLIDHSESLKDQNRYWDTFHQATPAEDLPAVIYGEILWGITDLLPDRSEAAVDRLETLYCACNEEEAIAVTFANGLVNLSAKQSEAERPQTVQRLEELYKNHSESPEIAAAFATGLFNLSVKQSEAERPQTVQRLEELYKNHSESPEIAAAFAKGLVSLIHNQAGAECLQTIHRLEILYQTHLGNSEIAALFSGTLVRQSFIQDNIDDILCTLEINRKILEEYPNTPIIQLSYAQTWFNLTLRQDEVDIPDTVTQIADFLQTHPDALPKFRKALKEYLEKHPEHTERYRLLQKL